jgi:hypothetical protein
MYPRGYERSIVSSDKVVVVEANYIRLIWNRR